jgi:hypothetical protein
MVTFSPYFLKYPCSSAIRVNREGSGVPIAIVRGSSGIACFEGKEKKTTVRITRINTSRIITPTNVLFRIAPGSLIVSNMYQTA